MIVLSNQDIKELLSMERAIELVTDAMVETSAGNNTLPLRSIIPVCGNNFMGMMPGVMGNPSCYGIKLVSLFPENPASGYSSHQGAMILFEAKYGAAIAMMNADLLTAVRTAAASAVATRILAKPDATRLTIIGYGEQALHHVEAMIAVRPISEIVVSGRNKNRAEAFARACQGKYPTVQFSAIETVQEAVNNADIVCTVTASSEPVLVGDWINPGCHLNIVGASIPSKREIDTELVVKSSFFVDYRPSTFAQAGEFILAIEEGRIIADHIKAELGEVITAHHPGRVDGEEITLYRSLGIAAQDIAVAYDIYARANADGIGTNLTLD